MPVSRDHMLEHLSLSLSLSAKALLGVHPIGVLLQLAPALQRDQLCT